MMDRVLVVAAALLLVGTASFAQPNKEQYELQKRCGKQAAEVFAKRWGSGVKNSSKGEGSSAVYCFVQAKWCGTEAEWRTLIKPFMED